MFKTGFFHTNLNKRYIIQIKYKVIYKQNISTQIIDTVGGLTFH